MGVMLIDAQSDTGLSMQCFDHDPSHASWGGDWRRGAQAGSGQQGAGGGALCSDGEVSVGVDLRSVALDRCMS
jgi:hypothetical protein